jgi:hypothetical protein
VEGNARYGSRLTYFSRTRQIAEEGLQLRSWLMRRLLNGGQGPAPVASAEAWRLMLRWERCALLLQDSLSRTSADIPPHATSELREAAMRESQWILSARAQLHWIAGIAATEGIKVVALKSSAEVARGRNVQATDVDILTSPDDVDRLVSRLDANGSTPKPKGSWGQLAARMFDGAVRVEVHLTVSGFESSEEIPWDAVKPIDERPPLLRLAPHDHAWTVLCQAVTRHPDRQTRVRDLYVLRSALRECSPEERAVLRDRVKTNLYYRELEEMIGRAEELAQESDETLRALRRLYLLQAREPTIPQSSRRWIFWRRVIDTAALGAGREWQRNQTLRESIGLPRWNLRRMLVGAPLAFGAALLGYFMTFDEVMMERIP